MALRRGLLVVVRAAGLVLACLLAGFLLFPSAPTRIALDADPARTRIAVDSDPALLRQACAAGRRAACADYFREVTACWALAGRWAFDARLLREPYYADSRPCDGRNASMRDQELGHYWTAPAACREPFHRMKELIPWLDAKLARFKVLVVGDSLSDHMARSMNSLHRVVTGNDLANFTFQSNHHLLLNTATLMIDGRNFEPWRNLVGPGNFGVVLLNRGAHYVNDSIFLSEYKDTLYFLRRTMPDALLFLRTTVSGHEDCRNRHNQAPLRARDPRPSGTYNWDKFEVQNKLLERLVNGDAFLASHTFIMDVDPATSLRADSHSDCLHYCMPGPMDMWADMFVSMVHLADGLNLLESCAM